MLCGLIVLVCVAAVLFAYRDQLKGLIAKLRGQTPPTA